MAAGRSFICPVCRTGLDTAAHRLTCRTCGRDYPVVAGIPDLRLHGDRYLSLADDRAKAEELGARSGRVRRRRRRDRAVPRRSRRRWRQRYTQAMLDGEARGAARLRELGPVHGPAPRRRLRHRWPGRRGGAGRTAVTGVDLALGLAGRRAERLLERGRCRRPARRRRRRPAALRPPGTFDTVTSVEVLEHAADQRGFLHSCLAAVRPGGTAARRHGQPLLARTRAVRRPVGRRLPAACRVAAAYVRRRRHRRASSSCARCRRATCGRCSVPTRLCGSPRPRPAVGTAVGVTGAPACAGRVRTGAAYAGGRIAPPAGGAVPRGAPRVRR